MIDITTLISINDLSIKQTIAITNTVKKLNDLFDYLYTNPITKVKFRVSDMILKIHLDSSFLSVSKSRSRARGYYYFRDNILVEQKDKPQGSIY